MRFNLPGGPPDLEQAIDRLFRQILSFPLRLWRAATADLPAASTENEGGLVYDTTTDRLSYSNSLAWVSLMPYNAGAALTRVDDTNVTLTLGGTPATALLQAASLTLGWTGQLAVSRGGTGVATSTGTGNVVLSASPTLTGTVTAAAITMTGQLTVTNNLISMSNNHYIWGKIAAGNDTRMLGISSSNICNIGSVDQSISGVVIFGGTSWATFTGTGLSLITGSTYKVNNLQVVTSRRTGWTADTGTDKRTANATYAGTAEATYTQATIQTLMDAVRDQSQTMKALKADLTTHGLIGA